LQVNDRIVYCNGSLSEFMGLFICVCNEDIHLTQAYIPDRTHYPDVLKCRIACIHPPLQDHIDHPSRDHGTDNPVPNIRLEVVIVIV
jgi:hypothetical protein